MAGPKSQAKKPQSAAPKAKRGHKCRNILFVLVGLVAVGLFYVEQHPLSRSLPLTNILRKPGFHEHEIPDLSGKVIIVTGANTGLGKASVAHLYNHNAHVILTSRDVSKGEAAKADIISKSKAAGISSSGKIDVMELNLSSLKAVRAFAAAFIAKKLRLDVLMLNAGIAATPFKKSQDGIESQFAVNHVAHHLLTSLLLPLLKQSAPSRIVVVGSHSYSDALPHGVSLTLAEINNETTYEFAAAYGQSKLANLLFSNELAHRLNNTGVLVNYVHPGGVATDALRTMFAEKLVPDPALNFVKWMQENLFYTPEVGALTQVYAAVGEEVEKKQLNGKYFVPIAQIENHFLHPLAHSVELREKLWTFTEELIASVGK